jgi:hypothetical protein
MQPPRQSGVQAIGQEGDGDMRFDPGLVLMEDRPDGEVALMTTAGSPRRSTMKRSLFLVARSMICPNWVRAIWASMRRSM